MNNFPEIPENEMVSPKMKLPINYNKTVWQVRRQARDQYVVNQEGRCYHCKCLLSKKPPKSITNIPLTAHLFPENFFNWPVHLHHNHHTGMTIGAVHNYCNAVLWEYHNE